MQGNILGQSGGKKISDATVAASEIMSGKTAYNNEGKIVGTMDNRGSITITPSSNEQTFYSGYYESIKVNAKSTIDMKGVASYYTVASRW